MKAKAKETKPSKKKQELAKKSNAEKSASNSNGAIESIADTLNARHKRFAEEYVKDLNGTQAYKRAGYNVKDDATAAINATRLLRNDKVKAYIQELQNKRSEKLKVDAQYVLKHLIKLAEAKHDYVENKDRIKCLELIGKHIGMFTDKIEHSGSMNNNVAITSMTPEEREARIQLLLEKAKIIDAH